MSSRSRTQIPVVDIFAGPGGLGEGFSAYADRHGRHPFKIGISVEKEELAHRTLLLRSYYRQFAPDEVPAEYYQHLRGKLPFEPLISQICDTPAGCRAIAEARRH